MNNEEMREDLIRQIKAVGKSLITNAESISGTEKFLTDIDITASFRPHEHPTVTINKNYMPEEYLDSLQKELKKEQNNA